jgi:hypothetical protein
MWRRGPESKPVLCNACGARWIVKKTLEGYLPQSAGGSKKRAKPKTKRQNTTAATAPRTTIVGSKRVRKAPKKYEDESPSAASKRAGAGGSRSFLRLNLDKHVKVVSGIPSPLKPAKKRASVRKMFFKNNEFAEGLAVGRGSLDCRSRDSLLGSINLSRIINNETFCNILSENDRESLMKWLPQKDKDLLSSEESTSGDKKGGSHSFFVNDQILSSMTHYQDLLKDGLLEESSSQLWIPSKLARAEKTSRIDKPEFFIPQLGEVVYGENIPNKLLGINN